MSEAMRRLRIGVALAAAIAALAAGTEARADAQAALDRQAIGAIVREYLIENPEVIEEAMRALRANRDAARQQVVRRVIERNRDALFSHPMTPVSGDSRGDVTLVEFFDYQCGYCKRALGPMKELLAGDPKLRVAWKEFPILGPASRFAARAALAAARQGRYLDFHLAVMGARGNPTESSVVAIAEDLGLDVERLRRDMADPAIEAYLDETNRLARDLGITGTPAFVIGDTLVPGAVGIARLRQLIADVRAGG
ncbi:MAG: DsbA family protein [Alphaproteobacteria bacterium]|nr:DsbA family protein [Alphaproteobacteria bacterium]